MFRTIVTAKMKNETALLKQEIKTTCVVSVAIFREGDEQALFGNIQFPVSEREFAEIRLNEELP